MFECYPISIPICDYNKKAKKEVMLTEEKENKENANPKQTPSQPNSEGVNNAEKAVKCVHLHNTNVSFFEKN